VWRARQQGQVQTGKIGKGVLRLRTIGMLEAASEELADDLPGVHESNKRAFGQSYD
jgi:hypothetical protein